MNLLLFINFGYHTKIIFYYETVRHIHHTWPPHTHAHMPACTHIQFPLFPACYIDLVLILEVKALWNREATYGPHVSGLVRTEQELEMSISYSKGVSKGKRLPPFTTPAK